MCGVLSCMEAMARLVTIGQSNRPILVVISLYWVVFEFGRTPKGLGRTCAALRDTRCGGVGIRSDNYAGIAP